MDWRHNPGQPEREAHGEREREKGRGRGTRDRGRGHRGSSEGVSDFVEYTGTINELSTSIAVLAIDGAKLIHFGRRLMI